MDAEATIYDTMNGPSEFQVIGSLRHWDITDQLPGDHNLDLARRAATTRQFP